MVIYRWLANGSFPMIRGACNGRYLSTDLITALHAAGHIPDPYWGMNEYDVRWVAERDWTARRHFT